MLGVPQSVQNVQSDTRRQLQWTDTCDQVERWKSEQGRKWHFFLGMQAEEPRTSC